MSGRSYRVLAVDDDPDTRWATDAGTHQAWLEIELGRKVVIDRVVISEAYAGRVREYHIDVRTPDGAWRTTHEGKQLGEYAEIRFSPVTTDAVKLDILQATEGPTIWEFQVFGPSKK